MGITVSSVNLWVHDQQVALDFWVDKVGFEVRTDWSFPEMAGYRWLTVGPKVQPDIEVVLNAVPREPVLTADQTDLITKAMAQGLAGPLFLVTDDVRGDFERLRANGVEFTEEPEERPYGLDCGFRDPSGNQVRLAQVSQQRDD